MSRRKSATIERLPPLDTHVTFTQLPNVIIDEYMAKLSGAEFKLLIAIVRKTIGYHQVDQTVWITIDTFVQLTGLSRSTVIDGLDSLVRRGLVRKVSRTEDPRNIRNEYQLIRQGDPDDWTQDAAGVGKSNAEVQPSDPGVQKSDPGVVFSDPEVRLADGEGVRKSDLGGPKIGPIKETTDQRNQKEKERLAAPETPQASFQQQREWQELLRLIAPQFSTRSYQHYLAPAICAGAAPEDPDRWIILVPDLHRAEWLQERVGALLQRTLSSIRGVPTRLEFRSRSHHYQEDDD